MFFNKKYKKDIEKLNLKVDALGHKLLMLEKKIDLILSNVIVTTEILEYETQMAEEEFEMDIDLKNKDEDDPFSQN